MKSSSNLTQNAKFIRVKNAVAAGTTDVTDATVVDMADHESVTFVVAFGAIVSGAATTVKVQQGAAANLSDAADLAGSKVTVIDTDDNTLVLVEVTQPGDRYVRPIVTRATQNVTVDGIVAILTGGKKKPATQDTTVSHTLFLQTPDEGTA